MKTASQIIITPISTGSHRIKRFFCGVNISIKKNSKQYNTSKNNNDENYIRVVEGNKLTLGNDTELPDYFEYVNKVKIDNYYDMLKKLRQNTINSIKYRSYKLSLEDIGILCMVKSGLKECGVNFGKPKPANWKFNTIQPDNQFNSFDEWRTNLLKK